MQGKFNTGVETGYKLHGNSSEAGGFSIFIAPPS